MPSRSDIVRLLSDGRFHSGTDVGRALGVSRAAVCKAIQGLARSGLAVHRVPGRGYRLQAPVSLLEPGAILRALGPHPAGRLTLAVLDTTDSTNGHLLQASRSADIAGRVCLAEAQRQGRGRRGRHWVATPYHNVLMSLAWRFDSGPAALAGLSLAAGVAAAEALYDVGLTGVRLKWPNDLLCNGCKLGGLLIEMQGEAAGPTLIVLGIGVNVFIAPDDARAIDQPWVDMASAMESLPDRNLVVGSLLRHFVDAFATFAESGLAAFRSRWERLDAFADKPVRVLLGDAAHRGMARGIDINGGLVVELAGGSRRTFHAGEISLRSA